MWHAKLWISPQSDEHGEIRADVFDVVGGLPDLKACRATVVVVSSSPPFGIFQQHSFHAFQKDSCTISYGWGACGEVVWCCVDWHGWGEVGWGEVGWGGVGWPGVGWAGVVSCAEPQ